MSGDERVQPGADDAHRPDEDPDATTVLPVGLAHDRVPGEIRDVSFSTVVRGYDRREVDRYVERVNRVIAELEMSQSPQSAVKHALDRVGEQTAGVLQRAREAADELTTTALAEAEHATRRAKVEAEELVERAQAEADAIRVQSAQEAEEHLMKARAEAAETLRRAQEQSDGTRREAEERLASVKEDTRTAVQARAAAIAEVRATASELHELAEVTAQRFGGPAATPTREGAQPTEPQPPVEDVEPAAGSEPGADPAGESPSAGAESGEKEPPPAPRRPRR